MNDEIIDQAIESLGRLSCRIIGGSHEGYFCASYMQDEIRIIHQSLLQYKKEQKNMNRFRDLIQDCGLSQKGASILLDVRYDTVRNWASGRAKAPDFAIEKLEKLKKQTNKIFS